MTVKFVRLNEYAKIPTYAHEGDSGMDISASEGVIVRSHSFACVNTGLAAVIPEGYELQVRPRSGMMCVRGVVGGWGTVDNGYRGEIKVALFNHQDFDQLIGRGERIAQLVLSPVIRANIEEGESGDLTPTDRGSDGLGSTGA